MLTVHLCCVVLQIANEIDCSLTLKQPHFALQTLAKTAGVLSTVAFTTAGMPPAALAAKKAKEVVEVVDTAANTQKLLAAGAALVAGGAVLTKLTGGGAKEQNFLEAEPYWDQSNVPVNVYKNKAPFTGKVVSTKRIVGPQATGETCHIVIDHQGNFPVSCGLSFVVWLVYNGTRCCLLSYLHQPTSPHHSLQTAVLGRTVLGSHPTRHP